MTNASEHEDNAEHPRRGPGWHPSLSIKSMAVITGFLSIGVLATGCGGSSNPSTAGSSTAVSSGVAYTNCMRTHGVPDFPDPTASPGGGVGFQVNLNQNSPTYQAAAQTCQSLKPGRNQNPQVPSKKLAVEVRWAQCIRTHGVPTFPDPNAQGAFDSGVFDPTSSAFQAASQDCLSLQPTGSVAAVPGVPG
jgi:hypothetical protein